MINLGDEVEDTVTGFRGIAVGRHIFYHGPITVTVQPVVELYGTLPDPENITETQLKVIRSVKKAVLMTTPFGK